MGNNDINLSFCSSSTTVWQAQGVWCWGSPLSATPAALARASKPHTKLTCSNVRRNVLRFTSTGADICLALKVSAQGFSRQLMLTDVCTRVLLPGISPVILPVQPTGVLARHLCGCLNGS